MEEVLGQVEPIALVVVVVLVALAVGVELAAELVSDAQTVLEGPTVETAVGLVEP